MLPWPLAPRKRRPLAKGQGAARLAVTAAAAAPARPPHCRLPRSCIAHPTCRNSCAQDLTWYAKGRRDQNMDALREEKRLAKEQEEDMIRARLGLAPQKRRESRESQLDEHEVKELLKRGGREENEEGPDQGKERCAR